MRLHLGLVVGCLVACGSDGTPKFDAQNLGDMIFDDGFDNFPTGWSGTSAVPGVRSDSIGNPPPAMRFVSATLDSIETSVSATYADQGMVATADVLPLFDADGEMMFRFIAGVNDGVQPLQVVDFKVTRMNGVITKTLVNDVQVANADGFRTVRMRMDTTGTTLEVDGEAIPFIPTPRTFTTGMVYVGLAGDTSISSTGGVRGTLYVDNVRLYRVP